MPAATRIADRASGVPFIGSYAGTTAAQNIHIGFKPAFIHAINITDGDTVWEWCKSNITTVWATTTAVAAVTAAVTQVDDGTTIGFSLPTDAVINENGKTYYFMAFPE